MPDPEAKRDVALLLELHHARDMTAWEELFLEIKSDPERLAALARQLEGLSYALSKTQAEANGETFEGFVRRHRT